MRPPANGPPSRTPTPPLLPLRPDKASDERRPAPPPPRRTPPSFNCHPSASAPLSLRVGKMMSAVAESGRCPVAAARSRWWAAVDADPCDAGPPIARQHRGSLTCELRTGFDSVRPRVGHPASHALASLRPLACACKRQSRLIPRCNPRTRAMSAQLAPRISGRAYTQPRKAARPLPHPRPRQQRTPRVLYGAETIPNWCVKAICPDQSLARSGASRASDSELRRSLARWPTRLSSSSSSSHITQRTSSAHTPFQAL